MNIFTTDHPLVNHHKAGLRSHLFWALLVAFILSPLLAGFLWFMDVTDNGGSTGGFTPAPFWVDLLAAAIVNSLLALVSVSLLRLFAWLFRK